MGLKLTDGVYPLGPGGLPVEADPREELLQNAVMRLALPKGTFPYDRELGSGLAQLDPAGEHAADQAVALANEALLDLRGVWAKEAEFLDGGAEIRFLLDTPLGEETVTLAARQAD